MLILESFRKIIVPGGLVALVLLTSCHPRCSSYSWQNAGNLPMIDTSHFSKGHLENLDLLKGIDYWRIGMPKSYYYCAFPSDSAYESDTCHVWAQLRSYEEFSTTTLIFAGDTLSTIILHIHSHDIRALIRRLRDLYGDPNERRLYVDTMPDSSVLFSPGPGRPDPVVYSETPDEILHSVITWTGPEIPLYRDYIFHIKNWRESYWPDTTTEMPATRFNFYPHIYIGASWKSRRSLQLKVFREASLIPYRGDTAVHVVRAKYYAMLIMS